MGTLMCGIGLGVKMLCERVGHYELPYRIPERRKVRGWVMAAEKVMGREGCFGGRGTLSRFPFRLM